MPQRMRLVFCGTPEFAVPTLKHLHAQPDFEIAAVLTQPDRPRGRGQELSFSPVKQAALSAHIPVHQPEKIRAPEAEDLLRKIAPDAVVIIAYGQIIPARFLSIPPLGWINLHASLLPRYRGAAPINWAIVTDETRTGATTMRIDAGMDTGDILLQREMEIAPAEAAPQLTARLAKIGAPLMAESLRRLAAGTIIPRRQDHAEATYAPLLKKQDGRIDWNLTAREIYNRMRGFAPWPGAYTSFRGQTCHLWCEPVPESTALLKETLAGQSFAAARSTPGTPFVAKNDWFVSCGKATFLLLQLVKLEGRKEVSAADFAHGARLKSGEHFGVT